MAVVISAMSRDGEIMEAVLRAIRWNASVPDSVTADARDDLRHSFGTRMAGVGVPMRSLQEWLGHRDFATTLIYADYSPSEQEREWVEAAFVRERLVPPGVPRAEMPESRADHERPA